MSSGQVDHNRLGCHCGRLREWLSDRLSSARQATSALTAAVDAAEAETQKTQASLQKAQLELGMAELLGKLGQIFIDVNDNNFGIAADKVTPFSTAWRRTWKRVHRFPKASSRPLEVSPRGGTRSSPT